MEQLLLSLVGMADVFVVGFTGEVNISGVSLVNAFNVIFINMFTALAAGGAVVISQYIGRKEKEQAGEAASQLLTAAALQMRSIKHFRQKKRQKQNQRQLATNF